MPLESNMGLLVHKLRYSCDLLLSEPAEVPRYNITSLDAGQHFELGQEIDSWVCAQDSSNSLCYRISDKTRMTQYSPHLLRVFEQILFLFISTG